jgi:hypothetical protein
VLVLLPSFGCCLSRENRTEEVQADLVSLYTKIDESMHRSDVGCFAGLRAQLKLWRRIYMAHLITKGKGVEQQERANFLLLIDGQTLLSNEIKREG